MLPVGSSTIFDPFYGKNVTFLIDTSVTMYQSLSIVKSNLSKHLKDQAYFMNDLATRFNMVDFSTETTPWSGRMVMLNTSTVREACKWIESLSIKTGKNTLNALKLAFNDIDCHSCVLVTNDVPDQEEAFVLNEAILTAQSRPIHCIYVRSESIDPKHDAKIINFLSHLAFYTAGSLKIANTSSLICQNVVLASPQPYIQTLNPIIANQAITEKAPMYDYTKFVHPIHQEFIPLTNSYASITNVVTHTPNLSEVLVGKIVLARNSIDGFYYKGKCLREVAPHRFKIEFNTNTSSAWKDFLYQDTHTYDIIKYDDAKDHPIKQGDKVLAIIDSISEKYAPCEVLDGYEGRRYSTSTHENILLIVSFKNGNSRQVPFDQAIWISNELYDRIRFELSMPSKARKYLEENILDYPCKSLPGYPVTSPNLSTYSLVNATFEDRNFNKFNKKIYVNAPIVSADLLEGQARGETFDKIKWQQSNAEKDTHEDYYRCCSCNEFDALEKTRSREPTSSLSNRFGNPKVTIGLPDNHHKGVRKFPQQRSTSATRIEQKLIKYEPPRLLVDTSNTHKEELRQQFRRDKISKIQEFEQVRTNMSMQRDEYKDQAKRHNAEKQQNFFKDQKIQANSEEKEQNKFNYLRHVREDRENKRWKNEQEQKYKEYSSMLFKKTQKSNLNQSYHDRVELEHAFRQISQQKAQAKKSAHMTMEKQREINSQYYSKLKDKTNDDKLQRFRNNILARY